MPDLLERERITAEVERLPAVQGQEAFDAANAGHTQDQNLQNSTNLHAETNQHTNGAHSANSEQNKPPHAEVDAATMSRAEIINKCPYLSELVKVDPVKADEYVDKARETGMKEADMKKQGLSDAEIRKAKVAELRKQREDKKKLDAEKKSASNKENAEIELLKSKEADDTKAKDQELLQANTINPEEINNYLGSEDKKNIDSAEQTKAQEETKKRTSNKKVAGKPETNSSSALAEKRFNKIAKGINKLGIVRKVIASNANQWKDFNKGSVAAEKTLMGQVLSIYSAQKNKLYKAEVKSTLSDNA